MAELESTWEELEGGLDLATGERHTLILHRNLAEVIEVDERQFLPASHVLLPRAHPPHDDPALQGITGLSIVAHALRYAGEHGDRVLLVAAHAELPAGQADAEPARQLAATLSDRRADNVLAVLQGDRDAWVASCDGCDRVAFRHLLKWAATSHGVDCDPGELGGPGKADGKALSGLRRHYGRAETPDDLAVPDDEDFGAIFDLYLITLADLLEVKPEELGPEHAKLKLHTPEKMACGAAWPAPGGPQAEHLRSASKHRVDLIFFQTSEPIPAIDGVKPLGVFVYGDNRRVRKGFLEPEPPPVARCVRMTGMFFDTDKTFLLPSAIPVMRNLVALHEAQAATEILIVGHTDTTGEPDHNDALSLERAKAVLAFLQGDVESWYAWYGSSKPQAQRWGKLEDLAMLAGLPDGAQHCSAPRPIESYQTSRGLEPDDIAGSDTRHRLIGDYMALDGTTLPAGVTLTAHGCGENFPYVQSGDGANEASNRRVEFFLFNDAIEPPPPGENSAAGASEYGRWRAASISLQSYSAFGVTIVSTDSPHFAPEHETLEIQYTVGGVALADVTRLRLHVWARKGETLLGSVELARPYGGTLQWDGSYEGERGGELIGLRHGAYLIALDVETRFATSAGSNQVAVDVIPALVELKASADPAFKLSPRQRKAVEEFVKELGGGTAARMILDSPLFKVSNSEMNDDASFREYQALWGDGPPLPLLVKLHVKTKSGQRFHHGEVSKGAKLIFDLALDDAGKFEAALGGRALHAQAKTFLKKLAAHESSASKPHGCSAHADVGVLRGAATKRWLPVEPRWSTSDLGVRSWAARVECKYDAELDADCGVYFACGRMAGDVHHVTAYYEGSDDLDVEDSALFEALDAARKSKTLSATTWRRIFVTGNNKSASKTELDIPALGKEYRKAAVIIERTPGLGVTDITADWKKHYKATIQSLAASEAFVRAAAEEDPGAYPVRFVSFDDYEERVEKAGRKAKVAGVKTEAAYRKKCDEYAYVIYTAVARKFPLAADGLTFFKFGAEGDHNQWDDRYTAGIAPSIPGYTTRSESAFFVFKPGAATDTLIHEVGHQVFLAHAPGHFKAGEQPGGFQPGAHDQNDVCIMSYAKGKNGLCGLCLAKLAGWEYLKVSKDGAIA